MLNRRELMSVSAGSMLVAVAPSALASAIKKHDGPWKIIRYDRANHIEHAVYLDDIFWRYFVDGVLVFDRDDYPHPSRVSLFHYREKCHRIAVNGKNVYHNKDIFK